MNISLIFLTLQNRLVYHLFSIFLDIWAILEIRLSKHLANPNSSSRILFRAVRIFEGALYSTYQL